MAVIINKEKEESKKVSSNELKQRVADYKKEVEVQILEGMISRAENSQLNIQQVADRNPFSE